MAHGGQGAPLAPAFHQAITPIDIGSCLFLNLGGIANVTHIDNGQLRCGFDTGPANGLMDAWIFQHRQQTYDRDGEWASSGNVHDELLAKLLQHTYFAQPHPKSTGREAFNLNWLEQVLLSITQPIAAEDVQATLLQLTCDSITQSIRQLHPKPSRLYSCGGGANNRALIAALARALPSCEITTTEALGIAPDWLEASAFAWLAQQRIDAIAVDLSTVTGSTQTQVLGGLYHA